MLNGPPTKTWVPLSDTSIAYTSLLAFGFHGSRSPWISRTAAEPVADRAVDRAERAADEDTVAVDRQRLHPGRTTGSQADTILPVTTQNIAILLRLTPLTVVKSPPITTQLPSGLVAML